MKDISKSELAKAIYKKYDSLVEIFIKSDYNPVDPIELDAKVMFPEETGWGKLTNEEVAVVVNSVQEVADKLTEQINTIENAKQEGEKLSEEEQKMVKETEKKLKQLKGETQYMNLMTEDFFAKINEINDLRDKLENMWRKTAEENIYHAWGARLKEEFTKKYFGKKREELFSRRELKVSSEEMAAIMEAVREMTREMISDLKKIEEVPGMTEEEALTRNAERNKIKEMIAQWDDKMKKETYYMLMRDID